MLWQVSASCSVDNDMMIYCDKHSHCGIFKAVVIMAFFYLFSLFVLNLELVFDHIYLHLAEKLNSKGG